MISTSTTQNYVMRNFLNLTSIYCTMNEMTKRYYLGCTSFLTRVLYIWTRAHLQACDNLMSLHFVSWQNMGLKVVSNMIMNISRYEFCSPTLYTPPYLCGWGHSLEWWIPKSSLLKGNEFQVFLTTNISWSVRGEHTQTKTFRF